MVYEIVERNLNRIIATAPYLFAPKRENIDIEKYNKAGNVELCCSDEGYAIRVYGTFDDNIEMEDSRIYVVLRKNSDIITYEAFPICECKLLNTSNKNGFSMFIDPKDGLQGAYDVNIVIGDSYYGSNTISIGK